MYVKKGRTVVGDYKKTGHILQKKKQDNNFHPSTTTPFPLTNYQW